MIYFFLSFQSQGKVFRLMNNYALDRVLSKSSNENNKSIYQNYRIRRPWTYLTKEEEEAHYGFR